MSRVGHMEEVIPSGGRRPEPRDLCRFCGTVAATILRRCCAPRGRIETARCSRTRLVQHHGGFDGADLDAEAVSLEMPAPQHVGVQVGPEDADLLVLEHREVFRLLPRRVRGLRVLHGLVALLALYFAVVTLTTVGFGDISPVSWLGRLVTMGMILIGVLVMGSWIQIRRNRA